MTSLGNNVHIFARPERRAALRDLFTTVLGADVATVPLPGVAEPMMIARFRQGGSLSIELTPEADDSDQPRFATWLELRATGAEALIDTIRKAGIPEIRHPGHPFYFVAPGGQVFTVVEASP